MSKKQLFALIFMFFISIITVIAASNLKEASIGSTITVSEEGYNWEITVNSCGSSTSSFSINGASTGNIPTYERVTLSDGSGIKSQGLWDDDKCHFYFWPNVPSTPSCEDECNQDDRWCVGNDIYGCIFDECWKKSSGAIDDCGGAKYALMVIVLKIAIMNAH